MLPSALAARLLLLVLAALLLTAAVGDLRRRIIANRLNLAVALLAVPWWLAIGLTPVEIGVQVGIALAALAVFAACFAFGWMGGGDVKLITALALWLPLAQFAQLLVWMAIGGGVLTLAMLLRHRLRAAAGAVEVPYGVAIAGAALLIVANDILTTTAA